jgi:hypothetical protein
MFQRNILPPSSRSTSTPSKQHEQAQHAMGRKKTGENQEEKGEPVTSTAPEEGHICRSGESRRVTRG